MYRLVVDNNEQYSYSQTPTMKQKYQAESPKLKNKTQTYFSTHPLPIHLSLQREHSRSEANLKSSYLQDFPKLTKESVLPYYEPTKCSTKANGIIKAYAANTNQGIVREYNEDRVSIILNIMPPQNRRKESWPKCSFFGVYDGHGGSACADFLRDNLHQYVIREADFPWKPYDAIKKGFQKAEKHFIEKAYQSFQNGVPERSGSCAVVSMVIGDICYVANVGDSRAFMSAQRGQSIIGLSRDHKPSDAREQSRIQKAGGKTYQQGEQGLYFGQNEDGGREREGDRGSLQGASRETVGVADVRGHRGQAGSVRRQPEGGGLRAGDRVVQAAEVARLHGPGHGRHLRHDELAGGAEDHLGRPDELQPRHGHARHPLQRRGGRPQGEHQQAHRGQHHRPHGRLQCRQGQRRQGQPRERGTTHRVQAQGQPRQQREPQPAEQTQTVPPTPRHEPVRPCQAKPKTHEIQILIYSLILILSVVPSWPSGQGISLVRRRSSVRSRQGADFLFYSFFYSTNSPIHHMHQQSDDPRLGQIYQEGIDGHFVLIGFPHDLGAGQEDGPDCLRRFLPKIGTLVNPEYQRDLTKLKLSDYGNIQIEGDGQPTLEQLLEKLERKVKLVKKKGGVPIVIGGTKECKKGCVSEVGLVISFVGEIEMNPQMKKFVYVAHDEDHLQNYPQLHRHSLEEIRRTKIEKKEDLREPNTQAGTVLKSILDSHKEDSIHLSVSLECVNSAFAPGVSRQRIIGLTSEELLEIFFLAGLNKRVKSLDISDFNPRKEDYTTGILVGFCVYYFLLGRSG